MLASKPGPMDQGEAGPQGFRKNANEELRVERPSYQGHDLVHLQVWE